MAQAGPQSAHSSVIEKTLEHRFLADLCSYLWTRGVHDFAVSQSEVDHYGYDVIVAVGEIVRHIQLKLGHLAARKRHVSVSTRLRLKPSGCVIWLVYRPDDLTIDHYLWFGAGPGRPLPELGGKVTRHTKGNSKGVKAERPGHRNLGKGDFEIVPSVAALASRLFGTS
jgi:hypothetical protein